MYCNDCKKTHEWKSSWTLKEENRFILGLCPKCGSCQTEQ
jgi:hypothetical protein